MENKSVFIKKQIRSRVKGKRTMFCKDCGSKLEEGWTCCPYCGAELDIEKEHIEKKYISEGKDKLNIEKTLGSAMSDTSESKSIFLSRSVLKLLAIIALTCFFCPIFMVSCAGEELFTISGADLTLGFQFEGDEVEGNLIYGTLALFPIFSFCSVIAGRKKLNIHENYKKIRDEFYNSAAAAGATIIMIRYFKNSLIEAFKEAAIEITPCRALYIMSFVCVISVFLGGYQAYQMEPRVENDAADKVIAALKSSGKILVGSIGLAFIVFIIFYYFGGLGLDELSEEIEIEIERSMLMELGNSFNRL